MLLSRGSAFAIIVLSLLITGLVVADYPDLEYYVTDQVGVLLIEEIYDIEDVCVSVYSEKGAEMAVLIVNTTYPDNIDVFTVKTFQKSGIGQKGKDNGLLIVVSVSENAWRIEVGYGLQGVLPDILVARIAWENLVPYMNQSDYYSGLYYTTEAIGEVILNNYDGSPPSHKESWRPIPFLPLNWWQLLIAVAIIVGLGVLTKGRIFIFPLFLFKWKGGGGGFGGGRSGGGGASGRF